MVRSDNGSEFTSGPIKEFYRERGILRESSCVDTPEQNGRIERKHHHILNGSGLLDSKDTCQYSFGGSACSPPLINRTPTKLLRGKSPYELLYKCKPSYKEIRVFGTFCFARSNMRSRDKFASRSRRCVFLGYPFGQKGWRVYDLETCETFVSRDMIFGEN